jgi:dolichol-phosphate mannosyltransferase
MMTSEHDNTGLSDAASHGCTPPHQADAPLLSILLPAFNERATIREILQRVWDIPLSKQVIVVDDFSTDGTYEWLIGWEHASSIEIVRHEKNRGKGSAIRTALEHARGRFVVVQDADLEYDPQDIPRLIAPLLVEESVAVYGSRYLASPIKVLRPRRALEFGILLLNLMVWALFRTRLTDEATCYKVFRTTDLRAMELTCERFEFCPEVTAKACRLGIKILEIPVSYVPRTIDNGKKLRAQDGWQALSTLWKFRNWSPMP